MPDRARTKVTVATEWHRGPIDDRLFGSFVEHLGRCVYTGIYEPDHPTADAWGFRGDVAALVQELGVTLVRYPGGNFVSGYDWRDGIGPRTERPRRLDLAWRTIESNQVGTDDFLQWAARVGVEPMMAVNLGTAGIREAAELVEYCNLERGTTLSDLRRQHGAESPYGVRLWCLGNEMDGPWQIGHKTADEYGRLARETGHAMRLVDPSIELVVCGSSGAWMDTFGSWESTVLDHAWDVADYVSLHAYYEETGGDRASFLASGAAMDRFIEDVVATVDAVAARKRSRKRLRLSFDEWNVWYQSRYADPQHSPIDEAAPRLEDVYGTVDAVVVGDLLMSLVNHADRVAIGCLAQLVNVIAPIRTDPGGAAWRQAIFHPVAETIRRARGRRSLIVGVEGGELATAQHGDVPEVAAAATHDPVSGQITVFLTNRADTVVPVDVRHGGVATWRRARASTVVADERGPLHDAAAAGTARPVELTRAVTQDGVTRLDLPPRSWTVLDAVE